MEDPTPIPPVLQKRPYEEDTEASISTPVKGIRSEASTPLSVLSVRTPSPMQAGAPCSMASLSSNDPGYVSSSQSIPASSSAQQSAKRRRLTQQEKEDQRLEKEAKAKARADKKAQKEAEDKLKADQKAQKEEEKRKKNEDPDEKKRQREEEHQQKEEERLKKERSQMKLNAFFAKPKATVGSVGSTVVESSQTSKSLPTSLSASANRNNTNLLPPSPQKTLVKNAKSDYERYFLPFNLPAHTILAPKHAFVENLDRLRTAQRRLDDLIARNGVCTSFEISDTLKSTFPARHRRSQVSPTIAEIVQRVNGSSDRPIDLTKEKPSIAQQPLELLKDIPMKYIHFGEDVRPPYYGTYTSSYTHAEANRLARKPVARIRQDTNYDYDSEAEWEEPEEGEDLDSDGEDDLDDEAEDDMDGFLDDEEDSQMKRRLISGDLIPVSTGLCWEDVDKVSRSNDGSGAICTDFKDFTMGFLLESQQHSIDPFSTAYWTPDPAVAAVAPIVTTNPNGTVAMHPPRAPLAQRSMNGLLNTLNSPKNVSASIASKTAKPKRMIPAEQLPAFKAEIQGKDLTKIGMIEALKKVFPKFQKDAIANTLSVVAARVGPTEKEKRWVLINT